MPSAPSAGGSRIVPTTFLQQSNASLRTARESNCAQSTGAGGPDRRRQRKPTLASVAKQASKAALEVARYEVRPDGTVVVVTGKSEATADEQSVARRSQGDEAMKLPKYVQAWVDRDGRARCYFRRRGYPLVQLRGLPWSPSFMAAYEAALTGPRTAIGAGRIKPGSVAAVVAEYLDSQQFFASKSAGTQRMRRGILERFRAAYGDRPFALLPPEWIETLLDAKPPHAARSWLVTLRSVCQFAIKRGWLRADPTANIKLRPIKGDGFHTWTDDEIAQFEAHHPIGIEAAPRVRVVALHHTAALRRGPHGAPAHPRARDGVRTCRKQEKTGVELLIPVHPELQAMLDATPSEHLTFLVTATGKPYGGNAFSEQFRNWCDAAGLPKRAARTGCARRPAAGSPRPNAAQTRSWRTADMGR